MKPYIRWPLRALGFLLTWSFPLFVGGATVYLLYMSEALFPLLVIFGAVVAFIVAWVIGEFILEKTK